MHFRKHDFYDMLLSKSIKITTKQPPNKQNNLCNLKGFSSPQYTSRRHFNNKIIIEKKNFQL